jgi:hypothetical protein
VVRGTRVSQGGVVLDSAGIAIDTSPSGEVCPAVAFDGTNYLVTWEALSGPDYHILGSRVSPAGAVLDPDGIVISKAPEIQEFPALTFDGTNYFVVWERHDNPYQIYGARVTPSGTVLDSSGIRVGFGQGFQQFPAVAFDGANNLVVWADSRDTSGVNIYGARVTPAGRLIDSIGFAVATQPGYNFSQGIGSNGAGSLVTWQNDVHGVCAVQLDQTGRALDTCIVIAPPCTTFQKTCALFDGSNYIVIWEASDTLAGGIRAARISQSGVLLDSTGIGIAATEYAQQVLPPAAVFDGTRCFAVWSDDRSLDGYTDVYGARFTPQMALLDTSVILLSIGTNSQHWSSAAFDGTNYLVAWTDNRHKFSDIYAARVTPAGVNLDPQGIPICTLGLACDYSSTAFDGTNFMVTWTDGRRGDTSDVYAARVNPSGEVLDPQGIRVSTGSSATHFVSAVVFDGTNYLLTWMDTRSGVNVNIYGARLSPAGQVLDPQGIPISTGPVDKFYPLVACNDSNCLVTWSDWGSGSPLIRGARVSRAGVVLDPGGIAVSDTGGAEDCSSVASDEASYLVAWELVSDTGISQIRGARISGAGVVLDSFSISGTFKQGFAPFPAAVFDGSDYEVVWPESMPGSDWVVRGASVSPTGGVIDTFLVAVPANGEPYLNLAHGSGQHTLCTYTAWAGSFQGRQYNASRIWGELLPSGGIVESDVSARRMKAGSTIPTVVNGVLRLPATIGSRASPASLLSITGRQVMKLQPGANDVRTLAPGIYFIRSAAIAEGKTVKVVLMK